MERTSEERRKEALSIFEKFLEEPPTDFKTLFESETMNKHGPESFYTLSKMKHSTKLLKDPSRSEAKSFDRYKSKKNSVDFQI